MPQRSPIRGLRSVVSANRLLASLPNHVAEALASGGELIDLKRGTVLYEPEAKVTYAYFPLSGAIALVAVLSDGCTAEVAVFGPESVVAYVGAMLGADAFGRYIVQVSGQALRVSTPVLREIIDQQSELERRLRAFSMAFTRQTFQYLACNACHPVEQRCCKWLLTMADKARTDEVPITHDHLAEMLGVQRPTVSIIMRELQASRVVEQKRGCIRIVDRGRLQRCSCECYESAKAIYDKWLPEPRQ